MHDVMTLQSDRSSRVHHKSSGSLHLSDIIKVRVWSVVRLVVLQVGDKGIVCVANSEGGIM